MGINSPGENDFIRDSLSTTSHSMVSNHEKLYPLLDTEEGTKYLENPSLKQILIIHLLLAAQLILKYSAGSVNDMTVVLCNTAFKSLTVFAAVGQAIFKTSTTIEFKNNSKMLEIIIILLLIRTSSAGEIKLSERSKLVRKTTTVASTKYIYITEDYTVIPIPLNIAGIESSIDELVYKLSNIKYSSQIEMAEPRSIIGKRSPAGASGTFFGVIFQRVLNLVNGRMLCEQLSLNSLDLQNTPTDLSETILLHFEILVDEGSLICTASSKVLRGTECLDYILKYTKIKIFTELNRHFKVQ